MDDLRSELAAHEFAGAETTKPPELIPGGWP